LSGCISPFRSCGPPQGLGNDALYMKFEKDTTATCEVDQKCKFNKCSKHLFSSPSPLSPALTYWNSGDYDHGIIGDHQGDYVKKYVNGSTNIIEGSDLDKYCKNIQGEDPQGIVPYCYDYNDLNSSAYLYDPYKIKIIYSNFTN